MNQEKRVFVKVIMKNSFNEVHDYWFTIANGIPNNELVWAITNHVVFAEAVELSQLDAIAQYMKMQAPNAFISVETVQCCKTYSTFLHQFIARAY